LILGFGLALMRLIDQKPIEPRKNVRQHRTRSHFDEIQKHWSAVALQRSSQRPESTPLIQQRDRTLHAKKLNYELLEELLTEKCVSIRSIAARDA